MVMYRHQSSGKNHKLVIANKCFQDVANFKQLRMKITNQNCIEDEIKGKINSEKACYYSRQKVLASHFLPKILKTRIYKTIIFLVIFYWF